MTQVHEQERQLHREVAETVNGRLPDVDVLAVELGGPERLCVYIDHPEGVDHALCERVTETLRGYLDRYSLEVSSPGFERPVRTRDHFADAVGRRVALRTGIEVAGRKRFRGEVVEAGEREATIEVGAERFGVPYDAIVRGNLIEERR
jgi:ribosome maturation factor RimP